MDLKLAPSFLLIAKLLGAHIAMLLNSLCFNVFNDFEQEIISKFMIKYSRLHVNPLMFAG